MRRSRSSLSPETICPRVGQGSEHGQPLVAPIVQSTTYCQDVIGAEDDHAYSRVSNPTVGLLEQALGERFLCYVAVTDADSAAPLSANAWKVPGLRLEGYLGCFRGLMPGQGVIVGIGSIGYPPEYHAFPPEAVSKVGISQVMTITSTYDHRVIQGAESGAFLAYVSDLMLGKHDFYKQVFAHLNIPYPPYVLSPDSTPQLGYREAGAELDMIEKQAQVMILIRVFRVQPSLA